MTRTYHCMFEQSGTFKNEFKALGYEAYDYDILNDFGETDYQMDLFKEIEKAYNNEVSIFDEFDQDDVILAFFPCTRFEEQIQLHYRGTNNAQKKWTPVQKIEYDIKLHKELHKLYVLISQLRVIALKRGMKLMIENPYSSQHYLVKYWCIPATMIDKDRTERGDYFEKPTQYWFINFTPSYNFIFEPQIIHKKKRVERVANVVERSMISKEYANRFIREFILEERE